MTIAYNRQSEKAKRRELRKLMPKAERLLWGKIRSNQLGVKFRRQYSIQGFIVDFYSPEIKLAIELDGESHYRVGGQEYDEKRSAIIRSYGIKILRFTNKEVYENLEGVVIKIRETIENSLLGVNPTTPTSSPL